MSGLRNVIETPRPASQLTEEERRKIVARKTPPRKWADRHNGVMTQEYIAWSEAHPQASAEQLGETFLASTGAYNHAVYYPEEHDKELGDGSWVFVTKPPKHHAIPEVPKLSLWWARPHVLPDGKWGDRLPYQGVVSTLDGPLHLWPHEYVICRDPETFAGMEGSHIHALGGEALLDVDHVFYLQSRGISRHEASQLLFGQISQPGVAYMTFDDEVVDFFASLDRPVPGRRTG